jgi:hypothetical protein
MGEIMSVKAFDFLEGPYGNTPTDPIREDVPREGSAPADRPEAASPPEASGRLPLAKVPRLVKLAFAEIGIAGVVARWAEPEADAQADTADPWERAEPPGDPCQRCGLLLLWEDGAGRRHCLTCNRAASERSERLAATARRLRAAVGLHGVGRSGGRCRLAGRQESANLQRLPSSGEGLQPMGVAGWPACG